jgi:hypothetical protein
MRDEDLTGLIQTVACVDNKQRAGAINFLFHVDEACSQEFAKGSRGILSANEGGQERGAGADLSREVSRRTLVVHYGSIARPME